MDRCALFVDAGYVLADGAMAVHGTRHRESVSWDYAGLLSFMGSIARERTGRPLLRCYWYEATAEGRRTSEHDSLADLPGLKLRLGRTRPGRREGVEGEIRRDLTTLARNNAISDALLVSAEEDLAQVVADVQDLGIRVTIVHITVGGNWTISRSLRQECDDIIEIGDGHLRPFTQLVAGTDSLGGEEPYQLAVSAARALTNGHSPVVGPLGQQALAAGSHPAPPAIYTAPVVAEYQRAAQPGAQPATAQLPDAQLPAPQAPGGQPAPLPRRQPTGPIERQSMEASRGGPSRAPGSAQDPGAAPQSAQSLPAASGLQAQPGVSEPQRTPGQRQPAGPAQPGQAGQQAMPGQPMPGQQRMGGVPGQPGAPAGQPGGPGPQTVPGQSIPGQSMPGQSMPGQSVPGQSMPGQPGTPGQPMPPQSYAPPSQPAQGMPVPGTPGSPERQRPAAYAGPAVDAGAADHTGAAHPRAGHIRPEPARAARGAACAPGPVVSRPPGPAGARRACPATGG